MNTLISSSALPFHLFIYSCLPPSLLGRRDWLVKGAHWVTVWPLTSNGRTRTPAAFNQPTQLFSVSPASLPFSGSECLWLYPVISVLSHVSPGSSVLCLWHLIKCERGSLGMEHQPGRHTWGNLMVTLCYDPVKMHAHTPVTMPHVNSHTLN